jgi:hypothetical protein
LASRILHRVPSLVNISKASITKPMVAAATGPSPFDRDTAMKFDNFAHAIEFWRKVPRCMPLRPDSEPNRPLTCTTWDFEPFDVAE